MDLESFDVVVVGSGSAGCLAARRLVERGAAVLLLEAGPGLPMPAALTTIDAVAALDESARFRPDLLAEVGYQMAPRPYRRGWGLGGSAAVNTLVATVGDRVDYDRWAAEFGCPGWNWSEIEPHVSAVTTEQHFATSEFGPLTAALAQAALDAGHRLGPDSFEPDGVGVLRASLTANQGRRSSAREAYLDGGADGVVPGLTIRCGQPVGRVMISDGRVAGVELGDGQLVGADRVVAAAGAIDSPALLHRSGVAGPDVGAAVEDHPSFVFTVALRDQAQQSVDVPAPAVSGLIRWSSGSPGAKARASAGHGVDLMAMVMDHVGVGPGGRRYGAVIVTVTDVESRGTLRQSEGMAPHFAPGWLTDERDRVRLRGAVRHMAELLASTSLGSVADGVFIDDEGTPAEALTGMSDADLDRWLVHHPGPISHVASTCRLGGGTVGQDGEVQGAGGLVVVDGSVLPHLPNGNPHLPIMAVASKLVEGIGS